jgi:UPF0716 family protein affecting phage T7 exclusion
LYFIGKTVSTFCSIGQFFALCLLVPPVRGLLARRLLQPMYMSPAGAQENSSIIEGKWQREDDKKLR